MYGRKTIQIDLGLSKKFTWNALVADTKTAVIGADFLKHYQLVLDLVRNRLVDTNTLFSVVGIQKDFQQASIHLVTQEEGVNSNVLELLKQFPKLLKPPLYQETPPHDTVHYITTTGAPVAQRPYRLPPKDLEEIKIDYQEMARVGIVIPSN